MTTGNKRFGNLMHNHDTFYHVEKMWNYTVAFSIDGMNTKLVNFILTFSNIRFHFFLHHSNVNFLIRHDLFPSGSDQTFQTILVKNSAMLY
jgi:hypothetical protein